MGQRFRCSRGKIGELGSELLVRPDRDHWRSTSIFPDEQEAQRIRGLAEAESFRVLGQRYLSVMNPRGPQPRTGTGN